jgi:hypothetical protein
MPNKVELIYKSCLYLAVTMIDKKNGKTLILYINQLYIVLDNN